MRLQALLALLTMFALAFAGCAGDNGDPDDGGDVQPSATQTTTQAATSTTAASTPTSASSTTTAAQPPANKPPTGSISATVNGTNASFSLAGSDPDGDTVVWDLDFGDGETTSGTTLPATVEHTFLVGNYTVNFTITDGKDPVTYSVEVAALSTATDVGLSFVGDVQVYCLTCSDAVAEGAPIVPSISWITGRSGVDAVLVPLSADLAGRTFTILSSGGDPDAAFLSSCEASPATSIVGESLNGGAEAGIVPADAGCLVVWEFPPVPPAAPSPPPVSTITVAIA